MLESKPSLFDLDSQLLDTESQLLDTERLLLDSECSLFEAESLLFDTERQLIPLPSKLFRTTEGKQNSGSRSQKAEVGIRRSASGWEAGPAKMRADLNKR